MPKLIIDNISVTVPDGTSVLEAAHSAGIPVPHFCWHPALGKAGACRVCAVKMLDGPVKGVQMSCMLPAQDGMVVSTTDEEAVAMRRQVIEWLMINHPHDCPVCDEGGECLLQDYTIAGGHGIRRYEGKKRTHNNQYLGPHIEHEMNRCIQCYRCVRFYQEFAGGSDFGVMGSASKVYFGRFADGELESRFSGNLVDVCPTGVFTDKTARFRGRYWDYEMAPSVCPHCSLGCNSTPVARYRELLKNKARHNSEVNGWFICDKGRFTNKAVNAPDRPRIPTVDGREVTWGEALDDLIVRAGEIQRLYGADSIALVGSPRMSLEGNILLQQLVAAIGTETLCYFVGKEEQERSIAAVSGVAEVNSASQNDLREPDCVAIVNADLLEEGPMLALAVRQAWRNGAPVFLVGKDAHLAQAQAISIDVVQVDYPEEVPFGVFEKPVIICGVQNNSTSEIKSIMASGIRTICLLSGPNTFGAAMLAEKNRAVTLEEAIRSGRIKGIISFEADIPEVLLNGIPFIASVDWLQTEAVNNSSIFLPATAWVEMDGTFINSEGRAQRFARVMNPGIPVIDINNASHPPRVHASCAPGSDPAPSSRIIEELIERISGEKGDEPLSGEWEKLRNPDPEGCGIKVSGK